MRVSHRSTCGLFSFLALPSLSLAQITPLEPEAGRPKFSTTVVETLFGTSTVLADGLRGEIYHLPRDTFSLPKFSKLKPVGVIYTHCLNIPERAFTEGFPGVTTRDEWFAIDYTGKFYIATPGKYRFFLKSDDGSVLYIDGKRVVDNDGWHATTTEFGSVKLATGVHTIRVSYFQRPRYQIALVLGVLPPGERQWRAFSTVEFKVPANPE